MPSQWRCPPPPIRGVLATMHGKERVIAPLVQRALGVHLEVPNGFDTDRFGTFSREVPRKHSAIETARAKIIAALEQIPCARVGLASEGSFGPHPQVPFFRSTASSWSCGIATPDWKSWVTTPRRGPTTPAGWSRTCSPRWTSRTAQTSPLAACSSWAHQAAGRTRKASCSRTSASARNSSMRSVPCSRAAERRMSRRTCARIETPCACVPSDAPPST